MSDAPFTAPKVTPDGVHAGARVAVRALQETARHCISRARAPTVVFARNLSSMRACRAALLTIPAKVPSSAGITFGLA